jgi:hypothetical protein
VSFLKILTNRKTTAFSFVSFQKSLLSILHDTSSVKTMKKETEKKADGRTIIFYCFGDRAKNARSAEKGAATSAGPEAVDESSAKDNAAKVRQNGDR